MLLKSYDLAGEDGTGALPVVAGGGDGVGIGDGVVGSVSRLNGEWSECGELRNGF